MAVAGAAVCELGEGDLTISDLPAGSSVIKCDAVGRVVTYDDTGLTVPEPGTAVSTDAPATGGGTHGFTMEVASDAAAEGAEVADTDALSSTGACSDGASATADRTSTTSPSAPPGTG